MSTNVNTENILISKENTNEAIMYSMENSLQEWVGDEMNARGWNRSELARRAHVSRGTISNILNGMRGIGVDVAEKLANAFDVPPSLVMKKAGIIAERVSESDEKEEIFGLFTQLSPEERDEIRDLMKFKLERNKRNTDTKNTSRGRRPARSIIEQ